jgi:hypothetical protein
MKASSCECSTMKANTYTIDCIRMIFGYVPVVAYTKLFKANVPYADLLVHETHSQLGFLSNYCSLLFIMGRKCLNSEGAECLIICRTGGAVVCLRLFPTCL